MKIWATVFLLAVSSSVVAAEKGVRFDVSLKRNGETIDSSSASGAMGQPLKVSMKNGMFIDAVADAPASDGRSKTQVRINVFHRDDTDMTFEFNTRANLSEGLSFDYTPPETGLKFRIEVVPVNRVE
jgi:hypothetical protein